MTANWHMPEDLPEYARRFADIVALPAGQMPLIEAVLEVARVEEPDLDADAVRRRLDELEREVREGDPGPTATARRRFEALRATLADGEGYRGQEGILEDPRGSCLNTVLVRRTGLPILLAVIYLEMARRIGLPLAGVGMPARFLVRMDEGDDTLFADPFDGGRILDEAGCADLLGEVTGGHLQMQPEYLRPWSSPRILARVLNNLRAAYVAADDFRRARQVVDLQLILQPRSATAWRDRGLLAWQCLLFEQAVGDLEVYLQRAPKAPDAEAVRAQLESLRRLVASRN